MFTRNKKFELSPRLKFGVGRGYSQKKILKISAAVCLLLAVTLAFNAFRIIISKGGATTSANAAAPQVLGAYTEKPPAQDTLKFQDYKVQKGDTLFNISQKSKIEWTTLATLNNIKSPFLVKPGQMIKIPQD